MRLRNVLESGALAAARTLVRRLHSQPCDRVALDLAAATDLTIPGPDGPLRARLYIPAGEPADGPQPLLVYFHGGGFVLCDLESHDALCRRLAGASGVRILAVEYRLAPGARFPAMHLDGEAAWTWARAHADRLGADPERIGLGGDSAGGHMALWTALRCARPPAFLCLLYPLLSVRQDEWEGIPPRDRRLRLIGQAAVGYIRRQIADADTAGRLDDFDLGRADLSGLPPAVVAVMGLDPLRPGIERFVRNLEAASTTAHVVRCPSLAHGAFNFAYMSRTAAQALAQTGALLGRVASA